MSTTDRSSKLAKDLVLIDDHIEQHAVDLVRGSEQGLHQTRRPVDDEAFTAYNSLVRLAIDADTSVQHRDLAIAAVYASGLVDTDTIADAISCVTERPVTRHDVATWISHATSTLEQLTHQSGRDRSRP